MTGPAPDLVVARRRDAARRDDEYVRRARAEGYRARSAYKLAELDERYRLVRPGCTAVDLGAAPGAWSQYLRRRGASRVVAIDRLPMEPIRGVAFIQGDFREEAPLAALLEGLGPAGADLVLSDLAPNMGGMKAVDQPRAMQLAELAFDLAGRVLVPAGAFVVKVFQGEGFDPFVREVRASFDTVRVRKPRASRPRSPEVYVVACRHRV